MSLRGALDQRPGLSQREGLGVDGQRRLVTEQVAGHGGEDKCEFGMAPWDAEDVDAGIEQFLAALGGD